jgi:predicted nucleic acid-binding protein
MVRTPPKIYLDSSVLIAFLYEKQDHPAKFEQVQRLVAVIRQARANGVVSFYALPELYAYVQDRYPADLVSLVFRLSLLELFDIPIIIVPFLKRDVLNHLRTRFRITDPDDARHVAAALASDCDALITFDHDFGQVATVIRVHTPAEFLDTLEKHANAE